MAKTPTPNLQPDPLSEAIAAEEARLRAHLAAGGPVLAFETDFTLADYRRVALALLLAAESAKADDFTVEEVVALLADQLGRDAAALLANAEARAALATRLAREVWADRLNTERAKRQRAQRQAAR